MLNGFVAADDFKTVFARVAGARDEDAVILKLEAANLIFLQVVNGIDAHRGTGRTGNDGVDEFFHARSLHSDGGVIVRGVGKFQFAAGEFRRLRLQPRHVGFDAGGVDDEKINGFGKPVGVKIVNHAAGWIAHQGILALAGRKFAEIVRE